MAPNTTPSSGSASPALSPLDGPVLPLPVHPTAARRPTDYIKVLSPSTTYSDDCITAKFDNRGADVVVDADGSLTITPTVKPFEFRTQRKVPKTGYVAPSPVSAPSTDAPPPG